MPDRNKIVHVVTVSQDWIPRDSKKVLIESSLAILDDAASKKPDIACLPETFPGYEIEPEYGKTVRRMAAWAKAHRCWLIVPLHTLVDGVHYNSAVLLDRRGRLAGRYDKIHLTEKELFRMKVIPGPIDPPVFLTDFGTIGIQVCFDVNWPATWAQLKQKGAKIIFYPSAYPAHRNLSSLSWMNEVFIASSTKGGASSIYDVTGDVIARTMTEHRWAYAALCMGKRLFEWDFHEGRIGAVERKYGRRVVVESYETEGWFTLASLDPKLAVEDVISEFGLTPLKDYIARSERAQDKARAKVAPTGAKRGRAKSGR
jgi:beta-ureidopropionase